ncbi:hypothetical protein VTK26DRAFT_1352 [Humicola hyalothermophila]
MSPASVSSNTRATRSRYSSPQTAAANGATDSSRAQGSGGGSGNGTNGTEGQKQFMQRWLEPPVQVRASYHDDGLVRHGVLENMAPLGTLPKVGLFKKTAQPPAAPEQPQPVRKIVVKQKTGVPVPPPPPAMREEDETEEEDDGNTEELEENEDEDEVGGQPVGGKDDKPRASAAAPRSRRSFATRDTDADEDWAPAKSAQKGVGRRSLSRASTGRPGSVSSMQQSAANANSQPADRKALIDKVVEAAVDEALSHFRYPTAWALRTLYDENSSRPEFLSMIEKVFMQTADADTLEEFAKLMLAKKKEGKKENKGFYYFEPPSQNSNAAPPRPKRAPYGNLVKFDLSTLHLEQPKKSNKRTRRTVAPQPEREPRPEPVVPEPEPESEPEPAEPAEPELHPRKKRKSGKQSESASNKMAATTTTTTTNGGVNGNKANAETPSRRRTRARSVSSISSLSSARSLSPPASIQKARQGDEGNGLDKSTTPSRTSPVPQPQPITGKRRRSNAPRKSRNVSPSRSPSSSSAAAAATTAPQHLQQQADSAAAAATSQRQSPAADQAEQQPYEMPAVVDSPLFPNLNSRKSGKPGGPVPVVFASKVGKIDENDPKQRLRQSARRVTANYNNLIPVSNVRESSPQAASRQGEVDAPDTPAPATAVAPRTRNALSSARRATPAPREGRSTRSSLKRAHEDLEDQPSPTTANFPGSEAASVAADSRAGTPALRPAKKARTGLRVKNSPVKKKNGTSAGIPRPSGERSSPVGGGNPNRDDDNDDYCSSCGGNGELVCCDGCTRAFHQTCVDPVIESVEDMPSDWFCNVCRARYRSAAFPAQGSNRGGAFSQLFEKIDARNSSAFRLPDKVRSHFEGVRTGVDGEYEEIVPIVKPTRKKKSEEEQTPDFFRLRDAEGNSAICHGCQKGSEGTRPIIPCSVCSVFWHLDCLDPPMAVPPILRTWKCPLHIDDLLASVPGTLAPAHRFRKIKGAPVVKPAFSRGYVNNGYVEIELDDLGGDSGWKDFSTYGKIVRLPEKGIKLDFISRARENRKGKPIPPLGASSPAAPPAPAAAPSPVGQRSLEEQQAALNLARLAGDGRDNGVATLIDAMIVGPTHLCSAKHRC